MDFVSIDIETANPDMASICQIGIAKYINGILCDEWKVYVDPQDYFDGVNVSVHGIDESIIKGSPTFPEIYHEVVERLCERIVVSHTHFDRVAMFQAAKRFELTPLECTWLDSAKVARRTWKECAWKGYGLYPVCKMLGHDFKHHDALEDAKASAYILLAAVKESRIDLEGWIKRSLQPINPAQSGSGVLIKREGNPEGALYGEVVVFTGALEIPRHVAADMAAAVGCHVAAGVSNKTTLLIVGDQDLTRLAGREQSSKYRKAKELISRGASIRILKESDFRELVKVF